ncbi:alpha/beta fold hydrolase [Paragemmobacter ruber]|uniref:Alpha/beta fold hydrolase n=1 Tax=Paragemmobacter ruber TaxID=1985673 RepID=A0ABW9Y1G7_9RHOB|nr:alpha/beta hydrolase [Rhodobacter ruber]NBE06361.1 alpha/beta fold hydrolase [Rhodobacter ruber]
MTEPILFLPGLLCDARMFLPQIVHLGARHPLHIALPTQGETVEQMSDAILAAAPPKFILIGHGLGGDVALDILRRDLGQDRGRASRAVLISTDPLAEPPATAAAREARIVAAKAGRLKAVVAQEYPEDTLAPSEWRDDIMALLRDMALTLGEGVFLRQSRALQRRPDQQKTLRRANLPILVIAGAEDRLVPPRRQDFAAQMAPFAKLSVIQGAGHLPTLEQPEAVTAAIETFLAGPMMLRVTAKKPS